MSKSYDTAILKWIDRHEDAAVTFLAEMVKTPSDNPPGECAPHAAMAAERLEALGLTVEKHPVPQALVEANGMISATNLVVRRRFGDGPVIALNSHGDVVAPGEGWTHDPYAADIVDGWMIGRGAAVSKSDFATYVFALLALEEIASELSGAVELHLTYDEEAGGAIGPKWLLDEGISKPDFAFSAGFSYAIGVAHNGCLHLEAVVKGKSAHAAKPETGHDALEAATDILRAIYAHRADLAGQVSAVPGIGGPNITVGLISGGINTNVVPDKVALRLDRRMIPEEDAAAVESGLRELIQESIAGRDGIAVEINRIMLADPLREVGAFEEIAGPLQTRASEIFGEDIPRLGVPLYTDARHYSNAGIPTVLYGAGPRSIEEANAHRADERLPLADLHRATKVVALTLADMLAR
ncbi:MAG: M20/M25/M40 family metallo-hydrolase [Alphaproteobacteria bacterium]|nr:M20/M25/M40 family metallo-hydrolase [Alphaproteobacteria bacterium]